jgi:hypothetical protein
VAEINTVRERERERERDHEHVRHTPNTQRLTGGFPLAEDLGLCLLLFRRNLQVR